MFRKRWRASTSRGGEDDAPREIKDPAKARERTMNRAVKLLAAKPRSVGELRERLLEKNWTNDEIVKGVIEKLEEYGYLDDVKFAGDLALSKLRQKPQGKRRLQQALSQKKLSKENVEAAMESAFEKLPETELIEAAIDKRLRLKGLPGSREDMKKFYDHLLRRGFSFDLIRSKMSEVTARIPHENSDEDQLQ
jgi:regulatory protein